MTAPINAAPAQSYTYFFSSPGDPTPIPPQDLIVVASASSDGRVQVRNTPLTFGPMMNAMESMLGSIFVAMHISLLQKCRECPEIMLELGIPPEIMGNSLEAISASSKTIMVGMLDRAYQILDSNKDPLSESSHSIQQVTDIEDFKKRHQTPPTQ